MGSAAPHPWSRWAAPHSTDASPALGRRQEENPPSEHPAQAGPPLHSACPSSQPGHMPIVTLTHRQNNEALREGKVGPRPHSCNGLNVDLNTGHPDSQCPELLVLNPEGGRRVVLVRVPKGLRSGLIVLLPASRELEPESNLLGGVTPWVSGHSTGTDRMVQRGFQH